MANLPLKPGSDVVDRTDLDVDHLKRKAQLPNHIFRDVSRYLRRVPRPRYPNHAIRLQVPPRTGWLRVERRLSGHKEINHIDRRGESLLERDVLR